MMLSKVFPRARQFMFVPQFEPVEDVQGYVAFVTPSKTVCLGTRF